MGARGSTSDAWRSVQERDGGAAYAARTHSPRAAEELAAEGRAERREAAIRTGLLVALVAVVLYFVVKG